MTTKFSSGQKKGRPSGQSKQSAAGASRAAMRNFIQNSFPQIEAALAGVGFELVQAQCPVEDGLAVLRLFIDHLEVPPTAQETTDEAQGSAEKAISGVTLDDCVIASRAVEPIMDSDESLAAAEAYMLEVSSPGLDRPLVKEADFRRFAGRLVKLKLRQENKNTVYKGRLAASSEGDFLVETADGPVAFTYDQVVSGRLSLDDLKVS